MLGVKRKNIAYLLLFLYLGYYSAMAYFVHIHVYLGVVYVHSHPYKKAQNSPSDKQLPFESTHQHDVVSLFSLNQLSNITSTEGGSQNIVVDVSRNISLLSYSSDILKIYHSNIIVPYNLRAPPHSIS